MVERPVSPRILANAFRADGLATMLGGVFNSFPYNAYSQNTGLIAQDLRLPGQEFDSAAGWNHNGFREYIPAWGRYLQSDPIGLALPGTRLLFPLSPSLAICGGLEFKDALLDLDAKRVAAMN